MNPQLQIHVCRTYLHEAEAVAHLEQWPDVQIIPFPPLCSSPRSSQPLADQVFKGTRERGYCKGRGMLHQLPAACFRARFGSEPFMGSMFLYDRKPRSGGPFHSAGGIRLIPRLACGMARPFQFLGI